MTEPPDSPDEAKYTFAMAQVGFEIVGSIGLGLVLDYYLGWQPWGIIGGTVLGFTGGMFHLITLANQQEAARRRRRDGKKQ